MKSTSRPRNIVVIHTDEHHVHNLGCMGNQTVQTPNIDRLASEGHLFSNAYTCNGVCQPSRASLLTGRYPIATGCASNPQVLPQNEKTMPFYFGEKGYATGYFGKTHFGRNEIGRMDEEGWEESFIWGDQYNDYLKSQGITADYGDVTKNHARYWKIGSSAIPDEHYFENVMTEKACDFISQGHDSNFICFLSLIAPHSPFSPPEPYASMYDPDEIDLLPRFEVELSDKPPEFKDWAQMNRTFTNERELKTYLAHIYGLVSLVDDNVGKLIDTLKENGLYEQTLIVFTSDHGDYNTRYGIFGKSWGMDEDLIRVPLIMSHPDYRGSKIKTPALTDNTDLLPTLLDYADIAPDPFLQGESLLPVISGEETETRECIFAHNQYRRHWENLNQTVVRQGKWKYVHSTGFKGELYNLDEDPWETENLIEAPDKRDLIAEMRLKLLDWFNSSVGNYFDWEGSDFWEDRTDFVRNYYEKK